MPLPLRLAAIAAASLLAAHAPRSLAQCQPRWWTGGSSDGDIAALLTADAEGAPRLYAGGDFTALGGAPARNIGAWDGHAWREVGPGLSGPVISMTVHPYSGGPRLFIGGFFEEGGAGGGPDGLVWLDGDTWGVTPPGNPMFWTMGLCSFQGSLFVSAGVSDYVRRLDASGWSVPGGGLESVIHAGLVYDDGTGPSLYVVGSMVEGVRRWDGAGWRSVGGGVQGGGYSLAVFDDGRGPALYVGGIFARAGVFGSGAVPAQFIARWDGLRWETVGAGMNHAVHALEVYDDGSGPRLYAGGEFTEAGGAPASHIAAWNGASWSQVGGGVTGMVKALAVYDPDGPGGADARLAAGGQITAAGGNPASGVVFYGPCRADFTCDGQADFSDYLAFLNAYDSADEAADLNRDGLVDFGDYLEFINAYEAGC